DCQKWREKVKIKFQGRKITSNSENHAVNHALWAVAPHPPLQRSDSTAAGNDLNSRPGGRSRASDDKTRRKKHRHRERTATWETPRRNRKGRRGIWQPERPKKE
ncbi:hypothetical protein TGAM01_v209659, partial [Trichoderma gamsii]